MNDPIVTPDNLHALGELLLAHKWIAAAAIVIGALVRLTKSDTPLPWSVPARWRPILALGLGLLAGVLQAVASGAPFAPALLDGTLAAVVAMLGHVFGVEVIRNGKEPFSRTDAASGALPASASERD